MKKIRVTTQRIKILEYLKNAKDHPTADAVYKEIVKELPAITLATVYRNLNLLSEEGEISRIRVDDVYRYSPRLEFHQHLVCKNCNKIMDVFQPEISKYALSKIKSKNFTPKSVNITFYGVCKGC